MAQFQGWIHSCAQYRVLHPEFYNLVGTQVNKEGSVKGVRMREDQIHGEAQYSGEGQIL